MDSTDQPALAHIQRLTEEEHRLYERSALDDADKARLRKLEVELDQCWDLLRQRRARREFGDDPNRAEVRPASVVQKYEQ